MQQKFWKYWIRVNFYELTQQWAVMLNKLFTIIEWLRITYCVSFTKASSDHIVHVAVFTEFQLCQVNLHLAVFHKHTLFHYLKAKTTGKLLIFHTHIILYTYTVCGCINLYTEQNKLQLKKQTTRTPQQQEMTKTKKDLDYTRISA